MSLVTLTPDQIEAIAGLVEQHPDAGDIDLLEAGHRSVQVTVWAETGDELPETAVPRVLEHADISVGGTARDLRRTAA